MSDDLKNKFREYRDQARRPPSRSLNHPTFTDRTQLRELLAKEWPEAAQAMQADESSLLFRQVGHGRQAGALVELMYQVGNDAIGRRYLDQCWVDDETGWRWLMSSVGR